MGMDVPCQHQISVPYDKDQTELSNYIYKIKIILDYPGLKNFKGLRRRE